jgi:hypothetical protein
MMYRKLISTAVAGTALIGLATAMAQSTQSNPSTPSSSASTQSSSPSSSSTSPSDSQTAPTNQGKDKSRGAKEQQSQKKTCPDNKDNSNVNCKLKGKASDQ